MPVSAVCAGAWRWRTRSSPRAAPEKLNPAKRRKPKTYPQTHSYTAIHKPGSVSDENPGSHLRGNQQYRTQLSTCPVWTCRRSGTAFHRGSGLDLEQSTSGSNGNLTCCHSAARLLLARPLQWRVRPHFAY
jgi:hypothetical protein